MLRGLNSLASLYRDLGSYQQSLRFVRQGLEVAARVSADASQTTGLYATAAWDFTALGRHTAALEYEAQALSLGREMNNPLTVSRYHVQMGLIHARLKDYEEAARSIRRGLGAGRLRHRRRLRAHAPQRRAPVLRVFGNQPRPLALRRRDDRVAAAGRRRGAVPEIFPRGGPAAARRDRRRAARERATTRLCGPERDMGGPPPGVHFTSQSPPCNVGKGTITMIP